MKLAGTAEMLERFSPAALNVLRAAGWSEGRHVNISSVEALIRSSGFVVHPTGERALREFSGLKLMASTPHGPLVRAAFHDEQAAIVGLETDGAVGAAIEQFNRLCEEPPCPVGWSDLGYIHVLPSGRVVKLYYDWLGIILWPDIEGFIETVCDAAPSPGLVRLHDHQKPKEFYRGTLG